MSRRWELEGFLGRFDEWVDLDGPATQTRRAVLVHVMTRAENPYADVRRESGFENLWFGEVPRTRSGWSFVLCSYWILERDRVVRCDRIATLSGSE